MYLYDGFRATAFFGLFPALELRIKEIHWPEVDMGGSIDTTVMHNRTLRTAAPKALMTVGKITMTVQYDPKIWGRIFDPALNANGFRAVGSGVNNVGFMGRPQSLVLTAPNAATLTLYVFVNKFTPAPFKEGEFPLAELEVIPTNTKTVPTATGQQAHDELPTSSNGDQPDKVVA